MFLMCLVVTSPVSAQGNRENLEQMRDDRVPELQQQRIAAESRAIFAGLPLRVQLPSGEFAVFQAYVGDRPVYYITENAVAADTV